MIIINLPQFPFRGIAAPYLWVFYKFLFSTKGNKHFFAHRDYLLPSEEWKKQGRWELGEEAQRSLGYRVPTNEDISSASCSLMPDGIFERMLLASHANPLKVFERILSETVPDLMSYYSEIVDDLLQNGEVNAIFSPINCPSLQEVAKSRSIPLVHFELGPLRGPAYVDLAYFDFQGLNEKGEFSHRYGCTQRKFNREFPIELADIRDKYIKGRWLHDCAAGKEPSQDVGVVLQIEDDTNLIASSNGFNNQALIAYSKLKFNESRVVYKSHPGSFFHIKIGEGAKNYQSAAEFLFDCKAILTINSSMGLEALLWGKEVYLVGRAAYEVITALEDEQQRYLALEFFLSNYLVPFELVFNMEYINFRLSDPNEEEIALRHRVEIDKVIAEEAMRDLEQRAVQCDEKIVSLNQIIAECDSRIVGLSQTVRERDGQIVSLSQMMSERDSQIASLSQEVSGRRDQIDSMNQAMSWRDGRIADLCQIVSERDAQVAILNETVSNLNDRLDSLDYALQVQRRALDAETERVLTLLSSKSWRITKPLRLGLDVLSSFGIYLGGAAKKFYHALPLTKQAKANHHYFLAKEFPLLLKLINSGPPLRMVHEEFVSDQKNIIESSPVVTQNLVDDCIDSLEISYPLFSSPAVSIIIPVYGKINYTLRCLSSIKRNLPKARFEVIVVNDCSQDNTVQELRKIHGLVLVNNTENLGFIRSCNAGAKVARGEYLCFLNNDTEVKNGWLDELLRTFSEFPGAGLVGSKLIYPDGRLQEAGGIIWKDGSAWNFGRFQDPNLPVYNYAREVDYCSGASIMMPKVVFDELKGFDEHYIPAYCEDSDIALKVRDKGYRVIYQPLSMVIHYEGVTSGTDTTQGIKQYQIENSKKLFERWQGRLISHQASGMDVDNAKDRKATRRVLVLDHCTPTPNQDAGSVTVFNLLLLLREMNFQVTFIPEDNFLYMPEYTSSLQRVGVEVLYAPYVTSVVQHVEEYGARYDLAFLFRPEVIERHLKSVRKHCPNAKVLYHTVDLHYLRMTREAQLQSNKAKQEAADAMQQREFAAMRAADASIVHSTVELELLRPLLPSVNLYVFPLIMEIKGSTRPFTKRKDIVFVGGYQHTPNVDAVKYFVGEIMPLLRKKLPGVCFYAVGSNPPAEIKDLASQDVEITGFVADLPSLLARMRVSVAPLRFGAGIKGKIGTAMAVGLPVVATSIAAEGMSLINEENILVADEPESIADAISRVYQNEALWNHISGNGINFADQEWGANAAWGILSKIIVDLGFEIDSNKRRLVLYSDSREIVDEVK